VQSETEFHDKAAARTQAKMEVNDFVRDPSMPGLEKQVRGMIL